MSFEVGFAFVFIRRRQPSQPAHVHISANGVIFTELPILSSMSRSELGEMELGNRFESGLV